MIIISDPGSRTGNPVVAGVVERFFDSNVDINDIFFPNEQTVEEEEEEKEKKNVNFNFFHCSTIELILLKKTIE